jgi:putative ABC transport system permease protein
VDVVELDLREPATSGLFDLADGRLPSSPDEAVVTPALADRGPGIGEDLQVVDGRTLRVVGVVEHASYRHAEGAVNLVGGFGGFGGFGVDVYGESGPVGWLRIIIQSE